MSFNIDEENAKLIEIINGDIPVYPTYVDDDDDEETCNPKFNFLCKVLALTSKYPQVELYLINLLLNHFTANELERSTYWSWSILHYMSCFLTGISLNSFEIIINFGIDINVRDKNNEPPIQILLGCKCNEYNSSVLNLFIKHGANLNIGSKNYTTILDILLLFNKKLNEETKNYVMLLIDFGAITNKSYQNNEIYDFIQYYTSLNVKPAIKK